MTAPSSWTELLKADREGRVTWPKCPECDADVKSYEEDTATEPVYPVERMWPGGPVVERRDLCPIRHRIVSVTVTSLDCGHTFGRNSTWQWVIRAESGEQGV
jgi:hypothetical protein